MVMSSDLYILGDERNEPKGYSKSVVSPQNQSAILGILKAALNRNASDIHFQVGSYPIFRIDGLLSPYTAVSAVNSQFMTECSNLFLNEKQKKYLAENRQIDCSVTLPDFTHRFRINFFYQRNHMSGVFRANPITPPTISQLGLPTLMEKLVALPHGLVLITGATGCGKTTTLAALVNHMNQHRNAHIIMISDPIEYIHKNKNCLISQREIRNDATSFPDALRVALREDPDVIVVEEIRDLETVSMALTAAETGHLVIATLHTNDTVQTIDRIIDIFPPSQQRQVRVQLAMALQAVVCQVLVRKKDGPGRVAIFETMPVTTPIRHLIRDDQIVQIYTVMQTNRAQGMILLNDALMECVRKQIISREEAETYCVDTAFFQNHHKNR